MPGSTSSGSRWLGKGVLFGGSQSRLQLLAVFEKSHRSLQQASKRPAAQPKPRQKLRKGPRSMEHWKKWKAANHERGGHSTRTLALQPPAVTSFTKFPPTTR